MALRTTTPWACLVRSSQRFGLRVLQEHAAQVHKQHKDTPYLDSSGATLYVAGPFPWGATRQTITRLFAQWQWEARPLQPKGRSIDGKGLLWEIQASKPPQFSVYTLEHADILIAAAPQRAKNNIAAHQEIQGSARTMQVLKQQNQPAKTEKVDTLQLDDPWQKKQPKLAPPGLPEPPRYDMLWAKMEQSVKQQVQQHLEQSRSSGDEQMHASSDARVDSLEKKVQQLEETVQHQAASQQQHNVEVASQIQTLNHKVDTQTVSIQRHMDGRLQEQLAHIERLLNKPTSD